jgi:hypothetical protein
MTAMLELSKVDQVVDKAAGDERLPIVHFTTEEELDDDAAFEC